MIKWINKLFNFKNKKQEKKEEVLETPNTNNNNENVNLMDTIQKITDEIMKSKQKKVIIEVDPVRNFEFVTIDDKTYVNVDLLLDFVDKVESLFDKVANMHSDRRSVILLYTLLDDTKKLTFYGIKDKLLLHPKELNEITL